MSEKSNKSSKSSKSSEKKIEIKKKNYIIQQIDMKSFLSDINYENFPESLQTYDKDIKFLEKYTIEGYIKINTELHKIPNILYFINCDNKLEYIALNDTIPQLWYKVDNNDILGNILYSYDNKSYKNINEYQNMIRVYIGSYETLNLSFSQLQNFFLLNSFAENILSNTTEIYTKNKNMSIIDKCKYMTDTFDDDFFEFYFYSSYSKSLIKIENHNGHYIAEIYFNDIKNKNLSKIKLNNIKFLDTLPIDVICLFINLNFLQIDDILQNKKDLDKLNLDICMILAHSYQSLTDLKMKLEKLEIKNELKEYIRIMILKLDVEIKMIKLEKSGFYERFDNHFTTMISELYDTLTPAKMDDIPIVRTLVNEIAKDKIKSIMNSKILD